MNRFVFFFKTDPMPPKDANQLVILTSLVQGLPLVQKEA